MCNGYTKQQMCLMNRIRQLWEQHVYWTRFFIISTAADLGDLEPVTNRLLQNPKDFAKAVNADLRHKNSQSVSGTFHSAFADCSRTGKRSEKRGRRKS